MIIVEGPDGAGKTTLVNQLIEHYGFRVGERGTKNRDELYKYTVPDTRRALTRAVMGASDPIIWDRLFYSELVYYPYTTGSCAFNVVQVSWYEQMLKALGCPVVLCLPSLGTVIDNVLQEDRHEMMAVKQNIDDIWDGYDGLYRKGVFPTTTCHYDYTNEKDFPEVITFIDNYLNYRKERTA